MEIQKSKGMNKTDACKTNKPICITPANFKLESITRVVAVINGFATRGFDTREKFVNIVQELLPGKYDGVDGIKKLWNYYGYRHKDDTMSDDFEALLEKLKSE
ncbi:hypothetical protein [Leeuwenhoekiella sp. LLG6367-2.1]|uniref:hypothetical protein n=1 Tax=Leeuwenhoekiella sp. LLG6367-2.1 TaxID=3160833 RepID=UPI00387039FF